MEKNMKQFLIEFIIGLLLWEILVIINKFSVIVICMVGLTLLMAIGRKLHKKSWDSGSDKKMLKRFPSYYMMTTLMPLVIGFYNKTKEINPPFGSKDNIAGVFLYLGLGAVSYLVHFVFWPNKSTIKMNELQEESDEAVE